MAEGADNPKMAAEVAHHMVVVVHSMTSNTTKDDEQNDVPTGNLSPAPSRPEPATTYLPAPHMGTASVTVSDGRQTACKTTTERRSTVSD